MRTLALALLLIGTTAVADDVVQAAKEAKEKRKKSTTRVITNEDVKKAKGTLIETSAPAAAPAAAAPGLAEQQQEAYRSRRENAARLDVAEDILAQLEKELAAVEQSYYDENDLDRRDREIVKRFAEVKARVDAARADVELLRSIPNR